jgi:hypothetical protein
MNAWALEFKVSAADCPIATTPHIFISGLKISCGMLFIRVYLHANSKRPFPYPKKKERPFSGIAMTTKN